MNSTSVSIIICTRNRAESLRPTLKSIGLATVPEGWTVELLVVDNGSTDHTRDVVGETPLGNLKLRYVAEPKTGQCHARNTGLRETSGDIILFTDDDVRVPANWIEGMCSPILNGETDAVAGGIVFPHRIAFVMSRQPLLFLRSWFACSDYLDPDRPVNMIGANMAFHRRVLAQVPEFDVALGPGAMGFFDEALFSWRVLAAGYKIKGALDVALEHHFDLSRLTRTSLLELSKKMGRSHAYVFHHWHHQTSGMARYRLALLMTRLQWSRLREWLGGKTSSLPSIQRIRLEGAIAFCQEYLAQSKTPPRYPLRSENVTR